MARIIYNETKLVERRNRTFEMWFSNPQSGEPSIIVRRETLFLVDGKIEKRHALADIHIPFSSLPQAARDTLAQLRDALEARADVLEEQAETQTEGR